MAETPSPWNLGGLSAGELARRVWTEMGEDEITDRAAALAYYFLFALFPTLLFLTALLGIVAMPGPDGSADHVRRPGHARRRRLDRDTAR